MVSSLFDFDKLLLGVVLAGSNSCFQFLKFDFLILKSLFRILTLTFEIIFIGSGKRIGWGSALPTTNSTSTPEETNDTKQSKEQQQRPKEQQQRPKEQQQYPPLPPTANGDADGKNVPWAMHPPTKDSDATDDNRMSPPQHQQEKGERSYPPERYYHQPPHYHRDYAPHDRRYRSHPGPYVDDPRYRDDDQRYYSNDRYYNRRNDYHAPRPYSRDYRPRYDPRPPPEYMHRDQPRNMDKEPSAQSFDARNHVPNSYYESKDLRWGDEEDDDSVKHEENTNENQVEPNEHPPHHDYDHRYAYRDNRQRYDKMDYRNRYDTHHHYPRNYSNYRRPHGKCLYYASHLYLIKSRTTATFKL